MKESRKSVVICIATANPDRYNGQVFAAEDVG